MDQMTVSFSMISHTTVVQRGAARTVIVRDTKNGSVGIAVAVSITAGGVLQPFLVMKGKKSILDIVLFISIINADYPFLCYQLGVLRGQIEHSFAHFPEGAEYVVQENAWMDEYVMLQWIECVLHPWTKEAVLTHSYSLPSLGFEVEP